MRNSVSIRCQKTQDTTLLEQYVALRKSLYQDDPLCRGFRIFPQEEIDHYLGDHSVVVLMLNGNQCVGGGRLSLSTPEARIRLPLEEDMELSSHDLDGPAFLARSLPQLALEKERYCEFNRLIVHPDYRDKDCIKQLFVSMMSEAKKTSMKYMFGLGDAVRTRLNKQICVSLFSMNVTIFTDIAVPQIPEYEGVRMHLMMGDMDTVEFP